jgi:hypothetical protein
MDVAQDDVQHLVADKIQSLDLAAKIAALRNGKLKLLRCVIVTLAAACNCIHVRACIAQFTYDGVEDNNQIDLTPWQRSIDKHTGKLFTTDRASAVQAVIDHCISFDVEPVVPGLMVWCYSLICCRSRRQTVVLERAVLRRSSLR